jgi:hypothetical protein
MAEKGLALRGIERYENTCFNYSRQSYRIFMPEATARLFPSGFRPRNQPQNQPQNQEEAWALPASFLPHSKPGEHQP